MLVERGRQALERLAGHLARDAGAHHAAPDQLLELRRVALFLAGTGAEGEAVAEGEHHRVGRKARELRRAAAGGGEREQEQRGGAQPAHLGSGTLAHSSKMRARHRAHTDWSSRVNTPPIASRLPRKMFSRPSSAM